MYYKIALINRFEEKKYSWLELNKEEYDKIEKYLNQPVNVKLLDGRSIYMKDIRGIIPMKEEDDELKMISAPQSNQKGYKQIWVKKLVSMSDWRNNYSRNSSYTKLEEVGSQCWIGFVVCNEIPQGCQEITDYGELERIQYHRDATNTYPQPIIKKDVELEKVPI